MFDQLPLASMLRDLCGWSFFSSRNPSKPSTFPPSLLPPTVRWDELPGELVQEISVRLSIHDSKQMAAVCRAWDRIINLSEDTLILMQKAADSKTPWLLQEHSFPKGILDLYSLSDWRRCQIVKPKCMWYSYCCGTTRGWLIMIDGSKFYPFMYLWNPITNRVIGLPPLATIPCYIESLNQGFFNSSAVIDFVKRVEVFSVSISGGGVDHMVVAAILGESPRLGGTGQNLVLCTPEEDEPWTVFDIDRDMQHYSDVLFHNGMLYVIKDEELDDMRAQADGDGILEIRKIKFINLEVDLALISARIHIQSNLLEDGEARRFLPVKEGMPFLPSGYYQGWIYLAESISGELLLITRTSVIFGLCEGVGEAEIFHYVHNETRHFKVQVIKFDFAKGLFTLTSSVSLDDQALFVGTHGASSYKAEMYENCILFLPSELHVTDSVLSRDYGVFHNQDKRIRRCFPCLETGLLFNLGWFTPKLL